MKLVSAALLAVSVVATPAIATAVTCKTEQNCDKADAQRAPSAKERKAEREKVSTRRPTGNLCQDGEMVARCGFDRVPVIPFN